MTILQQLAEAAAGNPTRINEIVDTLSATGIFGRRHPATAGLTWAYYGGIFGTVGTVANGTVSLTASATNHIVVARATGAVSTSTATTNWDDSANYARLYKVVTGTSSITSVEDHRFGSLIASPGIGSGGTVTSVAASVPSFLSISGSPITTSGTLAITYSGTALPVANGGTGATSLTANRVLLGNGTSALQEVAPGSSGNVLTSNGTTWTSAAPAGVDADGVTYTPTTLADWDGGADPGDVEQALDQLAERVTDVEGGAGIPDGDKGDITVSGAGTTWTIDPDAVTYAKMQNVSTASRLLGRGDSGAGDPQEITLGSGLSMSGTTLSVAGVGLTNFTESAHSSVPNTGVPVVRLLATNAATDVDVALTPKGVGALTAQVADNATTGGNKRGANAVDWQTSRAAATQVASGGYSTIGGGLSNASSSRATTVAGGEVNSASAANATVGGGINNTASNQYATVAGGFGNTASGYQATIAGGSNNVAGTGNVPTVCGGVSNTASGSYATVGGGWTNTASGDYSFASGRLATTRGLWGAYAHASGAISNALGKNQMGRYGPFTRTIDATPVAMALDGGTAAAATSIVLPNNATYKFTADVSAKHEANATAAGWHLEGVIRRGATAGSTSIVGTTTSASWLDSGAATWLCVAQANTTLGSLEILVTGEASKNIRWTAVVQTVETVD